jgi:hypothetical protein
LPDRASTLVEIPSIQRLRCVRPLAAVCDPLVRRKGKKRATQGFAAFATPFNPSHPFKPRLQDVPICRPAQRMASAHSR